MHTVRVSAAMVMVMTPRQNTLLVPHLTPGAWLYASKSDKKERAHQWDSI